MAGPRIHELAATIDGEGHRRHGLAEKEAVVPAPVTAALP
jgi:hypothetical protein